MNRETYIGEYDEDGYINVCPSKKDFIEWANLNEQSSHERILYKRIFFGDIDFSKLESKKYSY